MHCYGHTVSSRGRTANLSRGFGEGSGWQRLTAEANSFTPLGARPTKAGKGVTWDAAASGRERPYGLARKSGHLQPEPGISNRQHYIPRNIHMPAERSVQYPAWMSFSTLEILRFTTIFMLLLNTHYIQKFFQLCNAFIFWMRNW